MEKGLIDLREGVTIDFELGSTFARTGCTGELLVDGFDLADMGPEPSDNPKDVHEERRKKLEQQKARYEAAVKRNEERLAKERDEYQRQVEKREQERLNAEQERLNAMTSEERWNEKLRERLASRRRRLGKALYEALNITEGKRNG
jgi:phosphoenolpyruvate-protein kinase (PTS system EI component)